MAYSDLTELERDLGVSIKARSIDLSALPTSYIAMDLETTGLDSKTDGIVEIAGVKVVNGEVVDTFQTLVNTDCRLSREASEVNGITRQMLRGAPKTYEALSGFLEWSDGLPMLGHNAKAFDRTFVERACTYTTLAAPTEWYDTMEIAQRMYGQRISLKNLCKKCGVTNDEAHRALSDSMATNECYQFMKMVIAEVTTDARSFPDPVVTGSLSGEVVCITGDLAGISRHDIMQAVVDNGGRLSNNVTLKVTILANLGGDYTRKVKKAYTYRERTGIRVLTADNFLPLVGIDRPAPPPTKDESFISSTPSPSQQSTESAYRQNSHGDSQSASRSIGAGCIITIVVLIVLVGMLSSCISSCFKG